jgi:hypothetical protein
LALTAAIAYRNSQASYQMQQYLNGEPTVTDYISGATSKSGKMLGKSSVSHLSNLRKQLADIDDVLKSE